MFKGGKIVTLHPGGKIIEPLQFLSKNKFSTNALNIKN